MTIYHINKENKIEECLVRGEPCIAGAANHFLSRVDAEKALNAKTNNKEHKLLGDMNKEERIEYLAELVEFKEKEYKYLKETGNTFFSDDIDPKPAVDVRVQYLNEKNEWDGSYRMNLETVRYNLGKINKHELLALLYVFQRIIKTQAKQYAVYIDYEQIAKDLQMNKEVVYSALEKENYIEYKLENYLVLIV